MKLGVALTGSDKNYCILPCVFDAFKKYGLDIDSFAVSNNLFTAFLFAFLNSKNQAVPKNIKKLKRWLRFNHINHINKIDIPILICNRDINLNCDVFFGNKSKIACYNSAYFSDVKLTRLINIYKKNTAVKYKKFLLSSCYISRLELQKALNLLGNDSYLIINIIENKCAEGIDSKYTADSNRCITLNLYIDEQRPVSEQVETAFTKNINKLYDFLFFSKNTFWD